MLMAMMLAAAALQPAGRWNVDFGDKMCVATRSFGEGDGVVELALRPIPLSTAMEIMVLRQGSAARGAVRGEGALLLHPSLTYFRGGYSLWSVADGRRMAMLTVSKFPPSAIAATEWGIDVGGRDPIMIAPRMTAALMDVLDKCQRDLLTGWGIDADETRAIAEPAEAIGSPANWVTEADYPPGAWQNGVGGTVDIMVRVDPDGAVGDCRNLRQSGKAIIDDLPCKLLSKRARYRPAIGTSGERVASHRIARFSFLAGKAVTKGRPGR